MTSEKQWRFLSASDWIKPDMKFNLKSEPNENRQQNFSSIVNIVTITPPQAATLIALPTVAECLILLESSIN